MSTTPISTADDPLPHAAPASSDADAPADPQDPVVIAAKAQAESEKYRDLAMRSQADFENFRKRAAREKEDAIRFANTSLLERLLPILDNFELGLQAARSAAGAGESAVVNGMAMVSKQLDDFLRDHGVTPIDAAGEKFDPNLHEALGQEPSAEVPEGHVVRQLRRGYKLKDRLLRAANVFVSKGAA
ncbi:MAG: nucleotide exchange factor GrpE [Verrucomicrobia bacterium]|nr:nucleotide exchange factor GrpE [Verrucomicrobiota bacterium]MBV9657886.1 nucleotide exchange factor GrpE [Verrucomicrobiota bacterium]